MAESSTPSCERWLPARCNSRPWGLAALMVAGLLAVSPGPGVAQTVQGQLTDPDTGTPVEGALVLLLNEAGEEVGGYLTNQAGRFIIRAPEQGMFTLRAERIGYQTTTSDPFHLEGGQQFGIRLETTQTAIELDEIRVEGDQKCVVRPSEGLQLSAIWEEARKALTLQDWAEREGLYRFQVSNYEREMDADARVIKSETRRLRTGVSGSPIRSLPVEDLMSEGFVRYSENGGYDYYGPDASVLLSDPFLDTHCFSLTMDPTRADQVGLSFEPVSLGGAPDISGTLWLDGATAELRVLEYTYTWSPWSAARGTARGRVAFASLPNGAWVIRDWWIRMPQMGESFNFRISDTDRYYVAGIKEVGGEITRYTSLDRGETSQMLRGVLEGQVWDSIRQLPLAGATVFLSGTSYASETDPEGNFLIPDLPGGVFIASFTHPRLDSLGLFTQGVEVEIKPGEFTNVELQIPSASSLFASICPEEEYGARTGVVLGFVREADSETPVPGASVTVAWKVYGAGSRRNFIEGSYEAIATSDSTGRYTACGVPRNTTLTIEASYDGRMSESLQARSSMDGHTVVNVILPG